MSGKAKHDWTPTELLALAQRHCKLERAARELQVAPSTLRSALHRLGCYEEFKSILDQNGPIEMAAEDAPDVLTSEGRGVVRREAELRWLRGEVKRLQNAVVTQEDLVERIVSMVSDPRPAPEIEVRTMEGENKRDVILPIFDMQFGTQVRLNDTPGGINEFSVEIFRERLARYAEGVLQTLRDMARSHVIENLVIVLGGDLVEGYGIFKEQSWQLELDPVEQVIQLHDLLVGLITKICVVARADLAVDNVAIVGIPGNHGRVAGPKAALPSTASWDYLLMKWLEDSLKNMPIGNFVIEPAGSLWFESQGWKFLVIHGDEIRGWGGIPYYGLTRYDAQAMRMFNAMFDYLLLGHHHRPAEIEIGYGEHLMSGNWVGATQLSRKIVSAGWPSQWLYAVSEDWGVGERVKIRLQKREELLAPTVHPLSAS